MSRPIGPKKLAAIEQANKLKEAKVPDAEIRQALMESGCTKAQALEIVPLLDEEKPKEVKAKPLDDEMKIANIEGAIHMLETIAQRLKPDACNRFPDLVSVKNDSLTWARKLKAVLS